MPVQFVSRITASKIVVPDIPATAKSPLNLLFLRLGRVQAELIGIFHCTTPYTVFWFSMYFLIVDSGAPPTVDTKYEFVHKDGKRDRSHGNS